MMRERILPYSDTKTTGAADFYFAINATFRFIRTKFGENALRKYWIDLGREYLAPVSERWKVGGLDAVQAYWRVFFEAEPSADVEVKRENDRVVLEVRICPAIRHLRAGARAIDPGFCQHCYFVSESAAHKAGFTFRLKGGNGSCEQMFLRSVPDETPQNMANIANVK